MDKGVIYEPFLNDELAAISVGISQDNALLDLDFIEDSAIESDFNFVLTRNGKIVEIQGSAEKFPLSWQQYDTMRSLSLKGVEKLFRFYDENIYEVAKNDFMHSVHSTNRYQHILE